MEGVQENGGTHLPDAVDALTPATPPASAPPAPVPPGDPPVASFRASPLLSQATPGIRPALPTRSLNPWFLSPAVFLLAALATFLLLFSRTGLVTASTPQAGPLFDPRSASLGMRVETDGPGLLLSWNRHSPAVQAASSAVLSIQDGPQHRNITLDHDHVVSGSVFYRPASDDISFRLDLREARGPDVAQILRVLDSSARKPASGAGAAPPDTNVAPATARNVPPAAGTQAEKRVHEPLSKPTAGTQKAAEPVQLASAKSPIPAPPLAEPSPSAADPVTTLMQSAETPLRPAPPAADPLKPPLANPPAAVQSTPNAAAAAAKQAPVPGYVPPRPLRWVQPDGASRVSEPLDIKVKIRIDETGHVTAAHALIEGPRRDRKLMAAAVAAVRQWTFEPAKAHGTNIPCEETIVIHLGPEAQ